MKAMLAVACGLVIVMVACKAEGPGKVESALAIEAKKVTIGGKEWTNPVPDSPEAIAEGKEHFQHHCQICHGNDGHGTGVPFKDKMSPPIVDLGEKQVQDYT